MTLSDFWSRYYGKSNVVVSSDVQGTCTRSRDALPLLVKSIVWLFLTVLYARPTLREGGGDISGSDRVLDIGKDLPLLDCVIAIRTAY